MYSRHIIGKRGEQIAIDYLKGQGYVILEKNFSSRQGEIDIIAKDKEEVVFVEVKTRTNFLYGKPIEAVDLKKQKHLLSTAKYYLLKHNLKNSFIRIDIIEIFLKEGKRIINHIKNCI